MTRPSTINRFAVKLSVLSPAWSTLEDQQFVGTGFLEVGDKALAFYLGV